MKKGLLALLPVLSCLVCVSGYSGGPAFNMKGELIGISNAAFTQDLSEYGFDHLGLLIPIDRVKDQIEAHCG